MLEVWETSDCTVSVVRHAYGLAIKVNSNYYLGATSAMRQQVRQGFMPMLIQPGTKSVCFLGLGTGITAGAALSPYFASVERVVACELVPEIVTAARIYMAGERPPAETRSRRTRRIAPGPDLTGGLFTDSRVEILIEDGRHYLMATDERFDMINADLFLPYRRGAGSLYSREHFEQARARLNAAGIFVQWLPAFQMTETEFGTVAKTMLSVFDQVTLWRHDFEPGKEIVALMGHRDAGPLLAEHQLPRASRRALVEGVSHRELQSFAVPLNEATMPLFYCGNVTAARELFEQYPLNTDDRPVVEYSAPRSIRQSTDGFPPTLVGPRLAALVSEIFVRCPPERDPMLAEFRADTRRLPVAGAALHEAWIGLALNDLPASREGWARFVHAFADEGGGAQLATPSAE